ncbi:uncharacterized protein LOC143266625 [Megachile rotundata]|uniref:uncharacterized protein LOC143266625 n=1 Tax=Megachile rotundata TaxID=143995 RepID=UPI003FD4E704
MILKSSTARDLRVICYADDTLVLLAGKNAKDAISKINEILKNLIELIESLGLQISPGKAEALIFGALQNNKEWNKHQIMVKNDIIKPKMSIKYLGVITDTALNFRSHLEWVENKTELTLGRLARIMPNIRGPRTQRRILLASVVVSVVLYAAPVWVDTLNKA